MYVKAISGSYLNLDFAKTLKVLESPTGTFNVQAAEYGSDYIEAYASQALADTALAKLAAVLGVVEL